MRFAIVFQSLGVLPGSHSLSLSPAPNCVILGLQGQILRKWLRNEGSLGGGWVSFGISLLGGTFGNFHSLLFFFPLSFLWEPYVNWVVTTAPSFLPISCASSKNLVSALPYKGMRQGCLSRHFHYSVIAKRETRNTCQDEKGVKLTICKWHNCAQRKCWGVYKTTIRTNEWVKAAEFKVHI